MKERLDITEDRTVYPHINQTKELVAAEPCYSIHYARLFEERENGTARYFEFENEHGRVEHVFIKRRIPYEINGVEYYDISSPYAYGGPVIIWSSNEQALMDDYFKSFREYCQSRRIVSEFIRFHYLDNANVRQWYDGELTTIGPHIVRDLTLPLTVDLKHDVYRSLRRMDKHDITIHYDDVGSSCEDFLRVYHSTMDRNGARAFYYFDRAFLSQLHDTLKGQFIYVSAKKDGQVIASRLCILGDTYAFGFIGGTLKDYLSTGVTAALDYHCLAYIKERGVQWFSLGGGHTPNDGIYNYKKKFIKGSGIPFVIGKKIILPDIYQQLTDRHLILSNVKQPSSFFPAYRW